MPATLSQIQAWSTEHLVDAAAYWTLTADRWEDAFLTMRNQAQSITWHGAGGDALRQRTGADVSVVSRKADLLRQAAGIARNGASDISAAQRRVLYGVEDAQNAGFTVGEDLSVTDTRSTSPAERATRQAQAEAFAADLRLRAEQLDGADTKVSGQLTAATAGLTGGGFAQNSSSGHGSQGSTTSSNGGQSQRDHNGGQPQPQNANRGGVRLVDYTQDNASGPNPPSIAPWDTPDGAPPPNGMPAPPKPGFMQQYEQAITAPPAPASVPRPPMPAFSPPPNPGPAAAAAAKPPCSIYDATKALLEPVGGTVAILTAAPEGATGVGIPAALGQIALGTAAVADGLDAADKCLP